MRDFHARTRRDVWLLRAAWVAPMDGPMLRDGAVVFAGPRVAAVGGRDELERQYPAARVHHLGWSVILPGLVNAHTHLELSHVARFATRKFVEWLAEVIWRSDTAGADAAESGAHESLRFGVTCVGDITTLPAVTRPALASCALRVVSYGEVRAMGPRRGLLDERLTAATDASYAGPGLRVGVSPHAPYSVEPAGYARCLEAAKSLGLPLATHLAETRDEWPFLERHEGPFRHLLATLGAWDEKVPRFPGGPIRLAKAIGLLDYPTLLAHVNYCDDDEMALLTGGKASVVYCPRTHVQFGHPPHRWREMLARGINVAVGTDSRASSPDLNLVDDLRLMHRLAPEVEPHVLWEMATVRAARAVGMESEVGTLSPGKAADCVVFPARSSDPLREVLETDANPAEVWVAGTRVA